MRVFTILFLTALFTSACFEEPEFSHTPEISLEKITYTPAPDPGSPQYLNIFVNFRDGNGDLGLDGAESGFPYHPFDHITDAVGNNLTIETEDPPLPFYRMTPRGTRTLFSETDNRPPFSCDHYEETVEVQPDGTEMKVVYYIALNERRNNIIVDLYIKNGDEFVFYDWRNRVGSNECGENLHGRFPVFDSEALELGKPIAGTIEYSYPSVAIRDILRNSTYRMEVTLLDRAGNRSNTVTSAEFTLESITE